MVRVAVPAQFLTDRTDFLDRGLVAGPQPRPAIVPQFIAHCIVIYLLSSYKHQFNNHDGKHSPKESKVINPSQRHASRESSTFMNINLQNFAFCFAALFTY